jgi:hypothetical protein
MTLRCAVVVAAAVSLFLPGRAAADGLAAIHVTVDRTRISTTLGHTFAFTTTIRNSGRAPAGGLIAHLNVLSLRPGTYVDPEDWSSSRTRYLGSIPAGEARTVRWKLEAVNHGSFGVYVAVLPGSGSLGEPTVGPGVTVAVAERKTLNSGGILPLALGIPGLLGALVVVLRRRRRA